MFFSVYHFPYSGNVPTFLPYTLLNMHGRLSPLATHFSFLRSFCLFLPFFLEINQLFISSCVHLILALTLKLLIQSGIIDPRMLDDI